MNREGFLSHERLLPEENHRFFCESSRRDENYGKISRTKETIDQIGVPVEKGSNGGRFAG